MFKSFRNVDRYKIRRQSRESIEAEEIFLDSEKIKKSPESEREKIEFPLKKGKMRFIYFLIVVLLLILLGQAIRLQIIMGNYWRVLAEENRLRSYPIKSSRGIIYDRNGKQLVSNEPEFNLTVIPHDLLKQGENIDETLNNLAKILNESKEDIETLIKENAGLSIPIVVKENIPRDIALILENESSKNPSIAVEVSGRRNYIDGKYFSNVLGYLGKISKEELEKYPNYLRDDYIGKTSLEFQYENILRGSYGEKLVEVDSSGEIKNTFSQKETRPGKNIVLAIDSDLQKKLYDSLSRELRGLKTDRGAGIIMNPNTGEILALVSLPNLDNNKFIQGLSKSELEKINQNPSKPFLNRVISGAYAPGSTIKPLIALAALKEGIIKPNQTINCQGSIAVHNKYYPNIFQTFHDWKTHGPINLYRAIAESCNVYFYTIGGGYGNIEGLGIEKISQYLKDFGLGSISGIDLPQEIGGFVPDENWKKETKNENWYVGDTYNVSIGQGDLMATPLQMALTTAMIANGGNLVKPYLVSKIDNESVKPQILKSNIIDKNILDAVKEGMRETVTSGTAQLLSGLSVKIAGKTGTAQVSSNKAPHAWFTGFAPYDNPQIVITILIENGGEGSVVAVPVAKEVLEWYFNQ